MSSKKMLSYAQNGEDITLWQGFKGQKEGFYVDVGAAGPVQHSVTKLFYDMNWCGINIEPIKPLYEQLCEERPRDINLQTVISSAEGIEKLYVFPSLPGLTTTSFEVAEIHKANGLECEEVEVQKATLGSVLRKHCKQPIDFLKIDVEGTEAEVLQSFNLSEWRPRVLVVEATEPRTTIPSHQRWEDLVLENGYKLAQFDGLNRFYVLELEPDLLEAISRKAENYKTLPLSLQKSSALKSSR